MIKIKKLKINKKYDLAIKMKIYNTLKTTKTYYNKINITYKYINNK